MKLSKLLNSISYLYNSIYMGYINFTFKNIFIYNYYDLLLCVFKKYVFQALSN